MLNGNLIQKVTFLVTKSSRSIQTASGVYQICGIKDIDSKLLSINLYDKFIDSLEVGKVYTAMKIKKFNLKKDGEYQARLSSTKFSLFSEPSGEEAASFKNIQIADNHINATILGFSDISCYNSCAKHWNKIDDEGDCPVCKAKPKEVNFDFKGKLLVTSSEDDEEIKTFLFFKRVVPLIITEGTEEDVETKLAEYAGHKCIIEYDNSEEAIVIIRRLNFSFE